MEGWVVKGDLGEVGALVPYGSGRLITMNQEKQLDQKRQVNKGELGGVGRLEGVG